MKNDSQELRAYRVDDSAGRSKSEAILAGVGGGFVASLVVLGLIHFYWGEDVAALALIGVIVLWLIVGAVSASMGIAYAFSRLTGKTINEHQRADDFGESERQRAMGDVVSSAMNGAAALASATAKQDRAQASQDANMIRFMREIREAENRGRQEAQKTPTTPQRSDMLIALLGGSDAATGDQLLLTDDEDEDEDEWEVLQ